MAAGAGDGRNTVWLGPAYSQQDLVRQTYRKLEFWASMLTAGVVALAVMTMVMDTGFAGPLLVGVVARLILSVVKGYYRKVYDLR